MYTPPPNPPPFSPSSSTTSHQSLPATSPMSDDDDNPAVNFNGDTDRNNTTSSPPTEPKPSPSPSPSRSQSRSPSASPSRSLSLPPAQPLPLPPPPPSRTPPVFPAREDCWTEAATHTLVEAWGSHYVELNRGNLRQKHWQEVADAVNALHAHTKKQHRTDIQCKNRIDTLKKKYKIEKNQTLQSNGRYVSTWPFFNGLDALIGDTFLKNALSISPSPITTPARATTQYRKTSPVPIQVWKSPPALPPPPSAVPVAPRSKRPVSEEVLSRRNFSAMAAAAARAKEEEDDEDEDDDYEASETSGAAGWGSGGNTIADGFKRLAEAVGRFAEIYERVELEKQRQMVELEKQRMQFARDLEIQRMNIFAESQVHLGRLKRAKRNSHNDGYS